MEMDIYPSAVHLVLVPVGLGCLIHFHTELFDDSQPLVCVVLVTSDMFQGPAKWCCPNGSPHCLDYIKMHGKGIA